LSVCLRLGAFTFKTANTLRPDIYALKFHKRDKDGFRVLPSITYRKPRQGDIHPLEPSFVRDCRLAVPAAYIYGLKAVELRSRQDEVGAPYGYYRAAEKRIVLYSCPARNWRFSNVVWPNHKGLLSRGARIAASQKDTGTVLVEWADPEELGMFYVHVLFHEMGHHYVNQYRSSRGRPKTRKMNEVVAELHAYKISDDLKRRIAKKRVTVDK
jgi:hypothetical protein